MCDQAGECELQNYYMEHGLYVPRFNENKTKRRKAFPIGRYIILDQERCILCTRCIRFTRTISKSAELGVFERGHRSVVDVLTGFELNNYYSGNLADLCPVGALTDRDFRFKCRVWFLGRVPSICPGCSRGCNIEIHFNQRFDPRYHRQRVYRLKPRYNKEVNGYWICDQGRYSYHSIDAPDRLTGARIRRGAGYEKVTWEQAIAEVVASLKHVLAVHGPRAAAVLAAPQMSNEELFSARRLFRDCVGIQNLGWHVPTDGTVYSDDFLITADKNPNTMGARLILPSAPGGEYLLHECAEGRIHWLYIFGHDLGRGFDPGYVREALSKVECVVFQGSSNQPTAAMAHIQLPSAVYAEKEGTFTNLQGRVQRFQAAIPPIGDALADLEILARLAKGLGVKAGSESAAEVFAEIGHSVEAFAGMTYESVGDTGQPLKSEFDK